MNSIIGKPIDLRNSAVALTFSSESLTLGTNGMASLGCLGLCLAYSEYFGSAAWALSLSCMTPILHGYGLRVLDFHLFPALHTVSLHFVPPLRILAKDYHVAASQSTARNSL